MPGLSLLLYPAFPLWLAPFNEWLMLIMQISIVVPMVVVWRRRQHFAPAVRLLSGYVYLSTVSSSLLWLLRFLYTAFHWNTVNWAVILCFNDGKILLFALLYAKSFEWRRTGQVVLLIAVATVAVGFLVWPASFIVVSPNLDNHSTYARLAQCVVLAGFAMLYMERFSRRGSLQAPMQDPLYLLSIGQLLYSAGTVTTFSYSMLYMDTRSHQLSIFTFVGIMGLVFNYLLTLAFLRAQPKELEYQIVAVGVRPDRR